MTTVDQTITTEAYQAVSGARLQTHGDIKSCMEKIAALWSAYLGHPITAIDVSLMMDLLKTARIQSGDYCRDHYVDKVGYTLITEALSKSESRAKHGHVHYHDHNPGTLNL